jgi:hypothetical protein
MNLRLTVYAVLTACCLFAGIAKADAATVTVPYSTLITQCVFEHGDANHCEAFRIPRHPAAGELAEATATHRYYVTDCKLIHGAAEDCEAWFVPVGGQIIAPWKGGR